MTEPAPQQSPNAAAYLAAASAIADEQRASDAAEETLAALLLGALLAGNTSRAAIEAVAGPTIAALVLGSAMLLFSRSGRQMDLADWRPMIDGTTKRAIDNLVEAIEGREESPFSFRRRDVYARTDEGPVEDGVWSKRVAESTVTGAVEDAKEAVAESLGYNYKRWVSRLDTRVRKSHRMLEGITVPIDGYFITVTNAAMSGPHDRTAPLSEWINCRCRLLYVRRGEFTTV